MSKFWATGSSSASSFSDGDDSDPGSPSLGGNGADLESPPSPCDPFGAPVGGDPFSTPPRRGILPTDNPTAAWEVASPDQVFVDPQRRTGKPDPSLYTRIVCMSDTHGYHRDIGVPRGDVLIHGGDFTNSGEPEMAEDVDRFFGELLDRGTVGHIVCIAGNHELTYEPEHYAKVWNIFHHSKDGKPFDCERARGALKRCTYLEDEAHTHRGIHFYGSPWQPEYHRWAFNLPRTEISQKWTAIPDGTDVLITHGPPLGRGDQPSGGRHRVGCVDLMRQVQRRIQPRLHMFGHIHEGHGTSSDGVTLYVNASNVAQDYNRRNPCIVVDLPHDRSQPAVLVEPRCDLDSRGVIDFLKQHGHNGLVAAFESAVPNGIAGRDLLDPDAFWDICCQVGLHRDKASVREMRQVVAELWASSYG